MNPTKATTTKVLAITLYLFSFLSPHMRPSSFRGATSILRLPRRFWQHLMTNGDGTTGSSTTQSSKQPARLPEVKVTISCGHGTICSRTCLGDYNLPLASMHQKSEHGNILPMLRRNSTGELTLTLFRVWGLEFLRISIEGVSVVGTGNTSSACTQSSSACAPEDSLLTEVPAKSSGEAWRPRRSD